MKLRFSAVIATLGCALLVACVPYDESKKKQPPGKPADKTVTSADQQKIKEQQDKMKAEAEAKKKEAPAEKPPSETTGGTTTNPTDTPKPPVEEKRTDYAFANKVPGKEGFVFSPYNNKIVDVRDIPSGTLVQDPTYTGAGKGYFRVP